MCISCNYTIHGRHHHFGWDNALEPVARVAPGTAIEFECLDSSGGQLSPASTAADIGNLSSEKINPVTGPIWIDGAEPGDALKITIEEFRPSGFGWTANIPGFGLLADDFPEPALNVWSYDRNCTEPALFGKNARVPLKPFAGTIGNALAEKGHHSVLPPRRVGGNLHVRDLAAGTVLYLPVEVEGALFSLGDTHAAQGDGEVRGTAIESPMNAVLKLELEKQAKLEVRVHHARTSHPPSRRPGLRGDDRRLQRSHGSRQAEVSQIIDLIAGRHGIAPVEAYMLCSVCGDLRISEIVDMPNSVVSFYFPRCVFE